MSILCLGPKGSGKTLLLNALQDPDSVNDTTHSISTIGTNIFTIKLPVKETEGKKKTNAKQYVQIRELGGTMAPMWKNYYDDVEKIMYVIDTSNLCQISAAGVLLYSILSEPRLQHVKIIIILTKMDFSYRQMRNEALLMMQMRELEKQVSQKLTIMQASAISNEGIDEIFDWLAK
ncbi:ADP-ribosylation factor-like protein 16 [Culicoides brevitarsis]|uniref:ADP-ribosylation factor-like protein 16 n=1 Tax=Culicoides brevitarsis TaxID=469753 RepID=UPI00307CA86C